MHGAAQRCGQRQRPRPQIQRLLQTAEAIHKDHPNDDWLHLTGLIHDLGKMLLHPNFGELPQWAVVGDTFPVGCALDEDIVHYKYLKENPDYLNPEFNTRLGCGMENVLMSWGHDDYMYMVAKENKSTLPPAALFIIRYHSFYSMHSHRAYQYLMNEDDKKNLEWLKLFNKYDLYIKRLDKVDVEQVKPYYMSLINKYFPEKLRWLQGTKTETWKRIAWMGAKYNKDHDYLLVIAVFGSFAVIVKVWGLDVVSSVAVKTVGTA